ncbi:hypothetical protein Tco_0049004, partial [Tanacetum coccineum]
STLPDNERSDPHDHPNDDDNNMFEDEPKMDVSYRTSKQDKDEGKMAGEVILSERVCIDAYFNSVFKNKHHFLGKVRTIFFFSLP